MTQPATYLYAIPAIGLTAELVPVTFRTRMPMRGVVYAGIALVGVAALSGVTQQAFHDLPWTGSAGDNFEDLLPYAIFTLLPLLGVLIVHDDGPARRADVRLVGRLTAEHHGAVPVRLLRPRDDPRRHARPGRSYPIADLGLQGTVFEESALVYVTYGGVLCALGGIAWWLPKWSGRTDADDAGARPRPARRAGDGAGRAAVRHRRVRRPAGRHPGRTTTAARRSCGTCSSPSVTR